MRDSLDFLVVGAGLAGTFSAFHLASTGRTGLIDAAGPAAGASGAAVGLVNSFMGRKARTIWRFQEAESELDRLLSSAAADHLYHRESILRPALDRRQAAFFQEAAKRFPDRTEFLRPEAVCERYPPVHAAEGALEIKGGGWLDIPRAIDHLIDASRTLGLQVLPPDRVVEVTVTGSSLLAMCASGDEIPCRHILFATGYGYHGLRPLRHLDLHDVKGESLELAVDPAFSARLPCLSGSGHLIPQGDTLYLGSTYDHAFDHVRPTVEGATEIIDRGRKMVPSLPSEPVLRRRAGVRVGVPRTRLPMIGPLPEMARVWVFLGLGTKGVLMASLVAGHIAGWLQRPEEIPAEVAVRFKGTR